MADVNEIISSKITERAQVGDYALSVGLDMNCLPCIAFSRIEGMVGGKYLIHSTEDGIKLVTDDISGFYPDTPKNREIIKDACRKERASYGW